MRRREFISIVGGAVMAWPLGAKGQEPGQSYRLGGLYPTPLGSEQHVAMFEELRKLGFVEGQNLNVDGRGYGARLDRFAEIAAELVNTQVDIILAGGNSAIRAAQEATGTIPIVGLTDDMVGSGLVRSLSQPGGNTTGISILASELDGKRQELLMEAVPGLRRMAALADTNTTAPQQLQVLQVAVRAHGVELSIHRVGKSDEVLPAIDAASTSKAEALNVLASPLLFANRRVIFERTVAMRLPAIYQWPETAAEGGFAAYGPRIVQLFRLKAQQVAKVLRGTKPADLPVQQPTKFELAINLKTAKSLGIAVPPTLLARADEVIE